MENFLAGRAFIASDTSSGAGEPSGGLLPLLAPVSNGSPSTPGNTCNSSADPQVEIVNGKNGIERIIVVCTCGKRIELKCDYD
jgi:hypothetical protein